MEYKGMPYLRLKLGAKTDRVRTRYRYYEMKNALVDRSPMVPEGFKWLKATLGWCAKAVDSIADRLCLIDFADDDFDMGGIYRANNPDVLFDSAILSALISSCCFLYISADGQGYPRLQVIDGGSATGMVDPITGMLNEGYAVLERDDNGAPLIEAYFTKGKTAWYERGALIRAEKNNAPYALLVPIVFRPDALRPFGHSRISRACMGIMQSALRTLRRAEVSAEFYSFPQKYVTGLDPDAETMDKWQATMSSFLQFGKDEQGERPSLGQFTQQSMSPYTEQLRTYAALFAGETGLTLDDLGFVSDNPSSQEAIKAAHENLRLTARKAQRTFGTGFLNAGYLACCLRDGYAYDRRSVADTKARWEPIFEPDAANMSLIGDGVIKINQSVPGYFNLDNLRLITGMEPSRMKAQATEGTDEGRGPGAALYDAQGVQEGGQ